VNGRSMSNGALPDHSVWDAGGSPLVGHSPNDPHQRVQTLDPVAFHAS
jgi:hypothetical protein